jgi:hypothetical protein
MTNDQVEKLKQLAAKAARDAALPTLPDYRIHRIGKEIRASLKVFFPAIDFFIATSDGFDSMYGEHPPMVELRWNDGPSISFVHEVLRGFHSEDFYFETILGHGFTCRSCGRTHVGTLADKPCRCPDCGIDPCPW